MMVKGLDYVEKGIQVYEERMKLQTQRWLEKKAGEMGYQLTPSYSKQVVDKQRVVE